MRAWIICDSCDEQAFDHCRRCGRLMCAGHATQAAEKREVTFKGRVEVLDLYMCPECDGGQEVGT